MTVISDGLTNISPFVISNDSQFIVQRDASIRNISLHRRTQFELQNHFLSATAHVALIVLR